MDSGGIVRDLRGISRRSKLWPFPFSGIRSAVRQSVSILGKGHIIEEKEEEPKTT